MRPPPLIVERRVPVVVKIEKNNALIAYCERLHVLYVMLCPVSKNMTSTIDSSKKKRQADCILAALRLMMYKKLGFDL